MGLYFEELEIGNETRTAARTITEADVVGFCGLSGDFNPLHTDAEFAAGTPYGTRIAHGPLVLSVAMGLINQTGFSGALIWRSSRRSGAAGTRWFSSIGRIARI